MPRLRPPHHLLLSVLTILPLATGLAGLGSKNVCGAPPPAPLSKWTATSLEEADEDFAFQGEYFGSLPTPGGGPAEVIGLQVIARGGGDFHAVEYSGGLPGVGWINGDKTYLRGKRKGDRLWLAGNHHNFIVADNTAWVIDEREYMPTWIDKVHRISRTMGAVPPSNAIVLFDGTNMDNLDNAKIGADGTLNVGASTKGAFLDYYMHLEFQLPYMPYARGQGRANSGIYLNRRYELQILDSFGLEGVANECGALYRYQRPELNMCLPPLSWQTYEINFRSPRFDADGRKTANARIIVWHNGYRIHDAVQISRKTGGGSPEGPDLLPILFQDHHNPVRFRNVWLVDSTPPLERSVVNLLPFTYPPGTTHVPPHRDYWGFDW